MKKFDLFILLKLGIGYAADPAYTWIIPAPVVVIGSACLMMVYCWNAWPQRYDEVAVQDQLDEDWPDAMLALDEPVVIA